MQKCVQWLGLTCGILLMGYLAWTSKPVQATSTVLGPLTHVAAVQAGESSICALTTDSIAKCWGFNLWGAPEQGSMFFHPVKVSEFGSVLSVSTEFSHICAVTTNGGVKCAGNNTFGQLGNGSTTGGFGPVDVVGIHNARSVSVGAQDSCALLTTGGVMCWGDNSLGQLGDGTTTQRLTPVSVSGLTSGVEAISTGVNHACAVMSDHSLRCWGNNGFGQLGDGTTTIHLTPFTLSSLGANVKTVSAGAQYTCAVLMNGEAKCWGNNSFAQLGDGTTDQRNTPTTVVGLTSGVMDIATGGNHTCAVINTGGVKCWGRNRFGELGNGQTSTFVTFTPIDVVGLPDHVKAISASPDEYTCVILESGQVMCWGHNRYGQLGDGTQTDHSSPQFVTEDQLPTPTPTATPSPTPSPTPDRRPHALIFIPGMMGSELRLQSGDTPDPAHDAWLWPTMNKDNQKKMSLKDGGNSQIYVGDVVHSYHPDPFQLIGPEIYSHFIESMVNGGYSEYVLTGSLTGLNCVDSHKGTPLFVFPWDFRTGVNADTVALLKSTIDCARSLTNGVDVDIVAHSMGGLLGQQYVLAHTSDHHVRHFIDIATPWLGAPQSTLALLTGVLDDSTNQLIHTDTVQALTEHFTGAHQLLPSSVYFEHTTRPPFTISWLDDTKSKNLPPQAVSYDTFGEALKTFYRSPWEGSDYRTSEDIIGHNRALYANSALYDWSSAYGIIYHVIYGVHWQLTLGQIDAQQKEVCASGSDPATHDCPTAWMYLPRYSVGDGRVTLYSARKYGPGFNFNGNADIHRFADTPESKPDAQAGHLELTQNTEVQNCVLTILRSTGCITGTVIAASDDDEVEGSYDLKYAYLWGIRDLFISDGVTTTENVLTSTLTLDRVPGVKVEHMGDGAAEIVFLASKSYTVTSTSNGVIFSYLQEGKSNITPTQTISYEHIAVPQGSLLQLVSTGTEKSSLLSDQDGDGIPETVILPTSAVKPQRVYLPLILR